MLRFLAVLAVAGALFAGVFASAAALGVQGGTIQGGEDTTLQCDMNGVSLMAYGLNTYSVLEGVESIKVTGVNAACNGARIMGRVQLDSSSSGDNASWAYTSGKTPEGAGVYEVIANGGDSTVYVLFLKHSDYATQWYVPAEKIVGVKLWLEGPTN